MTAAEAKALVNASNTFKASQELARECIAGIDKLIEEKAKQGERYVIISSCDDREAASMYHHPTRWNEQVDWETVENAVRLHFRKQGFILDSYYNGASHLKIMW